MGGGGGDGTDTAGTEVAAPAKVEITSCRLGGHLLGRAGAVQRAIQSKYPNVQVQNNVGFPLQFSMTADDKQVLGGSAGSCTILQLLTCCTSPEAVANMVTTTPDVV